MSYIQNHIFELCRLKITRCIAYYFLTLSPYPQIKIPILIIKESHSSTLLPFFSLKFFQLFFTGIQPCSMESCFTLTHGLKIDILSCSFFLNHMGIWSGIRKIIIKMITSSLQCRFVTVACIKTFLDCAMSVKFYVFYQKQKVYVIKYNNTTTTNYFITFL